MALTVIGLRAQSPQLAMKQVGAEMSIDDAPTRLELAEPHGDELCREDSTSICSITFDEFAPVNVRGALTKPSQAWLETAEGSMEVKYQSSKRYAPLAKQLHLLTSLRRSARLDFGRKPRLLNFE